MPSFTINVNGENYTVGYDGTFDSPQGLIPALNNLGYGIFWIEQIGGVNVLTTVDDDDVWGTAETNSDPTTTSTTTTTTTEAPTTSTTTTTTTEAPTTSTTTTTTTEAPTTSTTTTTTTEAPTTSTTTTTTTEAPTTSTTTTTTTEAPTTSTTTTTTTICANYINSIIISDGSYTPANGTYTRDNPSAAFSLVGGNGAIFFGGDAWYIFNAAIGNAARNTSELGTGTWEPWPPASSTGITAVYSSYICPTTTSTTTTTTTLFAQTVNYASNATDACLNPTGTQNVTGNSTDFCTCTIFNSAGFVTLSDGNYVLAFSGNTLNINISGFPTTTATVTGGGCTTCPLSTSTTTTSTTLQQVWYQLTNCNGGGTVYTTNYDIGYAAVTDRVFGTVLGVPSTLVVTSVLFSDPAGTQIGIVNSGLTGCPATTSTTTTTTTLPPVTLDLTATCTGLTQTITIDNFAGGDGTTYYANDTTYDNPALAAGGATSIIVGGTRTYTTQPNGTRYIYVFSSTRNTVKQGGQIDCVSTTTTTTTTTQPPYVYYVATRCDVPLLEQYFRTTGSYTAGESVRYNGYCWEIQAVQGASGVDPDSSYINCAACNGAFPTTTTSTTTTSTTEPPVTASISSVCTGITQTITVDTFGGGDGTTYFANDTTYGDPVSAAAGATSIIVGGTRTYTTQPNGTRYVYITSGTRNDIKQGGLTCTTTTSSTTTTTTLAGVQFGVSITTKYATDYLACTGTVTGVIYQKAEFGNTPTVGAQLYTSSTTGSGTEWTPSAGIGLYLMQFGGSTKWSVLVGTTGIINTVTSCAGVSTTTTTTTLPAITVTATPSCDGSGLSGQGRVTANFSGGTSSYTWAAIASSEANAIACVNNPSCPERVTVAGSSSYAFTSLANGPYYVAVLDSNGSLGYSGLATVSCNATTTTTTTSSTTTTTTLAGVQFGVSITTKYATDFLACTGTVTGVVYQKAEFGNTPTVAAQLYTSSTTGSGTEWTPSAGIGLYLMQFGGSTKWSVLVGTTGIINTVTSCAGVSTTTTTTTLPAITVTATPSCDGSGFSGQGRVTANFSGGTGSYTFAAIGTSEAAAIACVNNPSCPQRVTVAGSSSYAFTSLANGPYYVAVLDSNGSLGYSGLATVSCNATTTTTTSTTTTTTTEPIVNYYVATRCDDPLIEQYFNTTGSYSVGTSLKYGGYCWEVQSIAELSGVVADSAYIDCASCNASNPTTSTTTTTTTAAPPAYDFYNADVYDCNDCSASIDTILVAFDAGTNVTLNRWYNAQAGPDGNSYRVTSVGDAGIAYLLALPSYNSCALACFV